MAGPILIHSFIHSAISIAPLQVSSTTQRRSQVQHGYYIRVSRRSAQTTAGKGLAQGPYVAAREGVKPTTLRLKVITSTKVPPRPTSIGIFCFSYQIKIQITIHRKWQTEKLRTSRYYTTVSKDLGYNCVNWANKISQQYLYSSMFSAPPTSSHFPNSTTHVQCLVSPNCTTFQSRNTFHFDGITERSLSRKQGQFKQT